MEVKEKIQRAINLKKTGLSLKEITSRLSMCPKTLKKHMGDVEYTALVKNNRPGQGVVKSKYQIIRQGLKVCSKCEELLPLNQFHKDKDKPTGFAYACTTCNKQIKRDYYLKNKTQLNRKAVERDRKDPNSTARKRKYSNSERGKTVAKIWREKNREFLNSKSVEYNRDPVNRLLSNQRKKLHKLLKSKKDRATLDYLGCSIGELMLKFEAMFTDEMCWHNYGSYWHVDHIKPCASFDLDREEERLKCFHHSNLQPLKACDNLRKNSVYNGIRYTRGGKSKLK